MRWGPAPSRGSLLHRTGANTAGRGLRSRKVSEQRPPSIGREHLGMICNMCLQTSKETDLVIIAGFHLTLVLQRERKVCNGSKLILSVTRFTSTCRHRDGHQAPGSLLLRSVHQAVQYYFNSAFESGRMKLDCFCMASSPLSVAGTIQAHVTNVTLVPNDVAY